MAISGNQLWGDLVSIVRALAERTYGPPLRGKLHVADQAMLGALRTCAAEEQQTGVEIDGVPDVETVVIGSTVVIAISPRVGFGIIVPDLDELLKPHVLRVREPTRFLLLNEMIERHTALDGSHPVSRYRAVLAFINTLRRAAAFLDQDAPALVFISDGKFEVPIVYGKEDLVNLSSADLEALTKGIPADTHEKECGAIMAEAIISMTKQLASYARFPYVLANLSDLRKRYDDGYRLYAAGFSYDKIKNDVEATRVEYVSKINKVFADIQNQLLAVPVATIIVATQMKDAVTIGYEFWVNTAVLVGCWVFALLMGFLIWNQAHTLQALRDEIKRQQDQMAKQYAAIAPSFSKTFESLRRRAFTQRSILWAIGFIVIVALGLSHYVYVKLTIPAADWLSDHFPCIGWYFL